VTWPDPTTPRLRIRTVEITDPGPLLARLPPYDGYAWIRRGDGLVAWGEVARHKPTSLTEADEWWSDLLDLVEVEAELEQPLLGSGLLAFGSFVFDPDNSAAQSSFVVPRTILGRRDGRSWLTTVGPIEEGSGLDELPALPEPPRGVRFFDDGLSEDAWRSVVADAVVRIGRGDIDKVVLARDLLGVAENEIDPRWLAGRLAVDYDSCWTYLVDGMVGATPEMLVRREAGLVTSRVLAGTIRRSGNDVPDLSLAAALSRSGKDLEEHEYAVQSVARALAPFCSAMNVPDAPYVLELPNVLHLATDVTAAAVPGASSLALAAALHPSAAVCGTPTDGARAVIAELEQLDRERYAGPVGWIDAQGDGEWAIALRCGQVDATDPHLIRLFAGCGIVSGSDPAAELAESQAKLVPMRTSLAG
jgi:menaquinone-specific isochorismate synthase